MKNRSCWNAMTRVAFILGVLLCWSNVNLSAQDSNLRVKGDNYSIESLEKGSLPFFNRTNMSFDDIPSSYTGWKYIKTNARSGYLPGPLPSLTIKADIEGFIYAMVANHEKPEICSQWAAANGWEIISDVKLSYGNSDAAQLYVYKKACVANTWINIVQPDTFSGAIIIAPAITDDNLTDRLDAVPVSMDSFGWMEKDILNNGTLAYANRPYVFSSVKSTIAGLYFSRYNGGAAPKIRVKAKAEGDLYIAISNAEASYLGEDNGWNKVEDASFTYNDPNTTRFDVYTRTVSKDEIISISTSSWQGVLVLSSDIEYANVVNFMPPPGVVIHNSKAVTKKFIGSPSLVVLKDGTYLASHDYFGSIISDGFVHKSTDKGETWEKIAEIKTLNWAKLFTRGDELYLMGVAPKGTMGYGDVVIMKSDDGGYTWTKPKNSSTGLLMDGFYTCAPTPVLFHKGRIWKAMENQGSVGGWGPFGAFMMSIDENADLMKAENWTISNELQYQKGAVDAWTWLEGNAVIDKDGSIVDILRLHYDPDDKAGIIRISDDGKTATFDPYTGIANLPGACKKFTINYDSISEKYWTLSSYVLPQDRDRGVKLERVRNTIVLAYSKDLIDWTIKDIILHHDEITKHGFQYVDWLFEGDDIIAACRTASDDETGQADSQHNANYLTFHRIKNFRYEKAGTTGTDLTVKRWYKNAKSAMALTFDDGFKAHYDHAYPILEEYGIKGTFFVNSGYLVNKDETPKERYGFWEDFKEMADNGHEIASHALTHENLTTASYDILLEQLEQDKANIETNIGQQCLSHAYPFCLHNEDVENVMTSLFIAGRQCQDIANEASLSDPEWYSVNSDILSWIYPRSLANEEKSIAEVQSKIATKVRQNRKFGVLCIHEVLPFSLLSTSDTYEIATTEWLTAMCQYLSEKQETGDIWSTTFSNIVRYAQERDNLRVKKEVISEGEIEYDFTTWLDKEIFNVPLTIDIKIPSEWDDVLCHFSDGSVSDSIYTSDKKTITLDIVPDRYKITLKNTPKSSLERVPNISQITVFPNPVKDIININGGDFVGATFKICNVQGAVVMNGKMSSQAISVNELSEGVYIFKLLDQDRREHIAKFIKK